MVVVRFLHIVFVLWAAATAYAVGRLGTLFAGGADARRVAVERLRGRILRASLVTLGATFVKLGQVMSTRIDLFAPPIIEELRKLQDKIPAFGFEAVRRTLEEDFGEPVGELFAELDEAPVAAASVAQVHRGRLHDGTEVAVKVLRPKIRERALADGAVLRLGARLLELSPTLRLSKPVEHLAEFEAGIVAQTDLRIEAANYEQFRGHFADDPDVVFPRTFPERSSRRVLTMEFVRGTKVEALPVGDHAAVASLLSRTFMKMVFANGFLHADLHPGNFLVLEGGRVAIFDVGLAKKLSRERLDEFVDFTRCIAMGTPEELVAHMKQYHDYLEGGVDWDAVARDVGVFVTAFRGKTKEELELTIFFDEMFALGRKYRVRPVTEFTLIVLGVMTAEGVGKMLDRKTDFMGQISGFLMPLMAARVAEQARLDEEARRASASASASA